MIKIVGKHVIDLLAYRQGILFVLKEPSANGQIKISYYSFDIQTKSIATVTKNAYLMTKFGPGFAAVTACLDDYISCEAVRTPDGRVFVVYPGGEMGVFTDNGELLHTEHLAYKKHFVRSIAFDGKKLWFAVPDGNAVVRYDTDKYKIDLRISGEKTDAFLNPVCVSADKNQVFVCCKNINCIKQIDTENYTVSIRQTFEEPVLQFLRIENNELVVLKSGIYLL